MFFGFFFLLPLKTRIVSYAMRHEGKDTGMGGGEEWELALPGVGGQGHIRRRD
jgi:hypothetical protein